jgi:hypothetical protein
MVTEQGLLLIVDLELNIVVVTNDKHDALSGDSQLLFPTVQFCDWMRNVAITESGDLLPISDFGQNLVQIAIEVTFEEAGFV